MAPTSETHRNSGIGLEIKTRAYQQEMLDESLKRNIIIALDTGSGKTHIAILRLKHEVGQEFSKVLQF
jgi:endoribonuclease Dicer